MIGVFVMMVMLLVVMMVIIMIVIMMLIVIIMMVAVLSSTIGLPPLAGLVGSPMSRSLAGQNLNLQKITSYSLSSSYT